MDCDNQNFVYYTIEKGADGTYICQINKDGKRVNHGKIKGFDEFEEGGQLIHQIEIKLISDLYINGGELLKGLNEKFYNQTSICFRTLF